MFKNLICFSVIILSIGCNKDNSKALSSDDVYTQFPLRIINQDGSESLVNGQDLYVYAKDDTMNSPVTIFDGQQDSVYALKSVSDAMGYSDSQNYPKLHVVSRRTDKYFLDIPVIYSIRKQIGSLPVNGRSSGLHTIYIDIPSKSTVLRGDIYWHGSNTNFAIDSVYINNKFFISNYKIDTNTFDTATQYFIYKLDIADKSNIE
ncbi:MAG: hypothetical protein QM610_06085 [Chitinophagaceae bacterium]